MFLLGRCEPLHLSRRSPALRMLQQARDEAHRFAITFQRKRRTVRTITSELLRIPGIGEASAALLLTTFGSLQAIREATPEQIGALPGLLGEERAEHPRRAARDRRARAAARLRPRRARAAERRRRRRRDHSPHSPTPTREPLAPRVLGVRSHAGRQHAGIRVPALRTAAARPLRLGLAGARRASLRAGTCGATAPCCRSLDGETRCRSAKGSRRCSSAALAREIGVARLWIKDEGRNPTASFKARGMSAAVTRAQALGVPGFVVPTAGNAGAALAAYGAAASLPVRVFAPASTPAPILATIRALGAELDLVDGHIGDAGKRSRAFAAEHGWFDMSTLREPYRIEGKKTMGIELAEQLGWRLPTHVVYPTGGGTGLIGMWKVFAEMRDGGWLRADVAFPRMISRRRSGCAPIVRAFEAARDRATPWEDPQTHASGLRVPGPLGDRLILRALRESERRRGRGVRGRDPRETLRLSRATGIDAAPEGGCALGRARAARAGRTRSPRDAEVVLFNTGSGASYRF